MFPSRLVSVLGGVLDTNFVTTWKTDNTGTSNDDQITLPLVNGGSYNFTADWGDSSTSIITAWDDAAKTHTYSSSGTYTVTIAGTIQGFYFNNGGDKAKFKTIENWGNLDISTNGSFWGCSNLTCSATDAPTISATDLTHTFRGCTNFNGRIGNWDVSSVTNMHSMFYDAFPFNQDIGNWDVSSVATMASMFRDNSAFNQDIGSWNVSNVTNMEYMFRSSPFNQDIGNWDVSKVTTMRQMLKNCDAMTSANLGKVKDWTITALTAAPNFMVDCSNSMSTADYDALLVAWEGQTHEDDVTIHVNSATYTDSSSASTARAALVTDGWTITDGGTA